jgi:hypothetical protein
MTPDEDNKVLRSILVRLGMVLCLFLTGCGNRTAEPADQEGIAVKTDRYDRTISEFNTVLAQNGVSTAVTQRLLEHSSSDLTNKVYTNVDPVLRQAVDLIPAGDWL